MTFNKRLKELRTDRKLTQTELANELNAFAKTLLIQTQTVSRWEKGGCEPSYETLMIIAKYFDVSVDYMLGASNLKSMQINSAFTQSELDMIEASIGELWLDTLIAQFNVEKNVLIRLLTSKAANAKVIESIFKTLNNVYQFYDEIGSDYSTFVFEELNDAIQTTSSDEERYAQLVEAIKKKLSSEIDNVLNNRINEIGNELTQIKNNYRNDLIEILTNPMK